MRLLSSSRAAEGWELCGAEVDAGVLREGAVELSVLWQRGLESWCHFFIAVKSKVGSTGQGLCARARLRVLMEPRTGLGTATKSSS